MPAPDPQGQRAALGVCERKGGAGGDQRAGAHPGVSGGADHYPGCWQSVYGSGPRIPGPDGASDPVPRGYQEGNSPEDGAQRYLLDHGE